MDNNFIAVILKKLFAVTGSAVFLINRAGLGIVDDMFFQCRDFRQPFICLLNRGKQGISLSGYLRDGLAQLLHAFNFMIP